MLLNQIAKHFPVREVTYEPDHQKFTFTTKKGILIFGFVWCALLLCAMLCLFFFGSVISMIQLLFYTLTERTLPYQDRQYAKKELLQTVDFPAVIATVLLLTLFLAEAKALHHLLLRVTILCEAGIIRRNSSRFNSSRELWKVHRIRSRSSIELRCGRTSMLILSNKTDHYDLLIEKLNNAEYAF